MQESEGLTYRLRKIPSVTKVTDGKTANAVAEKEGRRCCAYSSFESLSFPQTIKNAARNDRMS